MMLCCMPSDGAGSRSSARQKRWVVWTGATGVAPRRWLPPHRAARERVRSHLDRAPTGDRRWKTREIERDPRGDHVFRFEADRRLEKLAKRPQHQARGDERHDRQRDFRQDEAALQGATP